MPNTKLSEEEKKASIEKLKQIVRDGQEIEKRRPCHETKEEKEAWIEEELNEVVREIAGYFNHIGPAGEKELKEQILPLLHKVAQKTEEKMIEKIRKDISRLPRYYRSKFRENVSDAPEEGTVEMLLESQVVESLSPEANKEEV